MPGRRMLCTACGRTEAPDTLIGGSDLLELIAWCLFLLPGLVYCYWRNATRRKVCPRCGSLDLMREARASRERGAGGAPAGARGRSVYAARPIAWMGLPAQRLRRIRQSGAAALGVACLAALLSIDRLEVTPTSAAEEARLRALYAAQEEQRDQRDAECAELCKGSQDTATQRACMQSCVARAPLEASDQVNGCADLLDPRACDFVVGR